MKFIPTEAFEQKRLVDYLRLRKIPFTHVSNGRTSLRQGVKDKAMGVSPGFPDLIVFFPGRVLAIELKRKQGGRVSPEQKKWLETLALSGVTAVVARGFEQAKEIVDEFSKTT